MKEDAQTEQADVPDDVDRSDGDRGGVLALHAAWAVAM